MTNHIPHPQPGRASNPDPGPHGPVSPECVCGVVDHWEVIQGEDEQRPVYKTCLVHPECTCDRPPVARVFVDKCDEEFFYYRRCPEHEKGNPHPFSISTLRELNKFTSVSLTAEGRAYKRELEEKEKSNV